MNSGPHVWEEDLMPPAIMSCGKEGMVTVRLGDTAAMLGVNCEHLPIPTDTIGRWA